MSEDRVQRRLAAILVADMVGYSRLMEADERGIIARQKAIRQELIDPEIAAHNGRIVKTTGDGLLVEFASVVDATESAVAIQQAMAEREADVPEERLIQYRVGINLGDIVIDGDDILGDGVNIAARLETLAPPGGLCISGGVHDQIRNKLDIQFEDLGEQSIKNISQPVRVWRWPAAGIEAVVDVSAPVPGFNGRPAIAVLAFDNLSGDADQEYFADGIVEDVITRIATWRWIPVIARSSTFKYKGQTVDVRRVGRELGAGYVIEGSVRKEGNRVRITAQLIDTASEHHIWAERYDRELEDIFSLQNEIAESVVSALEPVVGQAARARARHKHPGNLDAWDLYQRGTWHFFRFTRDDFTAALEFFRRSADRDSDFALPLSGIALVRLIENLFAWSPDPAANLAEAHRTALAAVDLDGMDPLANTILGYSHTFMRHYDAALAAARRACELNPSLPWAHHSLGYADMVIGNFAEAAERMEQAIRISPNDDILHFWIVTLSAAYYLARDYEKARELAEVAVRRAPHYPMARRNLASALAQLGRLDEAGEELDALLKLSPNYTRENARHAAPVRDEAVFDHYMEGLHKAGLPR